MTDPVFITFILYTVLLLQNPENNLKHEIHVLRNKDTHFQALSSMVSFCLAQISIKVKNRSSVSEIIGVL